MNYSLTHAGILAMILVPLLSTMFTEACAGEVANVLLALPGAVAAWYGRYRKGDVNLGGFKK